MTTQTHVHGPEPEPADLRRKWETEFPGHTAAIAALREIVIDAEATARHTRAAFQHLQLLTENTGIDRYAWPPPLFKRFTELRRHQAEDNRHFTLALQALQNACASQKTSEAKTSAKTLEEPPPPPAEPSKVMHNQSVEVTVIDGQVVTTAEPGAAFWCRVNVWDDTASFCRHFHFPNAIIPETYAWVLTHQGVTHPPRPRMSIYYSPEEFKRLCELELETASEHLLDGKRIYYAFQQ
jgi:hypothetical protein